jgi:eukaryotic-like serine/threonine-protein kinase
VRLLGEGSFGQVWLADDLHLGRRVALKVIRPGGDPAAAARRLGHLRDEARLLAAVRHPNVVAVYAWREGAGGGEPVPVIVQRYVPGGSLAERVRDRGPLPWADATRYIADVADGLTAVHAAGVVHRDVKPANILWDPDADEAVLTDFGISTRLTDGPPPAGTLSFMPPEAFGGAVGSAQDVYGLAATLFWLLTGEHPFPGLTAEALVSQARRGLPDPDPRFAATPARIERLVRRGLAADPAARLGLAEFAGGLRGALNQSLADSLGSGAAAPRSGPLVRVSRQVGPSTFVPLAASRPTAGKLLRDLTKVPREPDEATAHTGERVRVEVEAHAAG